MSMSEKSKSVADGVIKQNNDNLWLPGTDQGQTTLHQAQAHGGHSRHTARTKLTVWLQSNAATRTTSNAIESNNVMDVKEQKNVI